MRATTLKAAAHGLRGLLEYYAGLAEDRARPGPPRGPVDYYLDPNEPPGRWWGRGLDALGLGGEVNGGDLRALLDGHHPRLGTRLGRRFGDTSARAFDATFSAPKSVSALWALSPDPLIRAEVLAAHDSAVEAALAWLEHHGAVTRRGRDGVDQVDTRGLGVAVFRQHTSRALDPQLHSHAVIAAKVQDPTGRWLSLDARFLKGQQRTIGWIYDAALRAELTGRLGVDWEPSTDRPADMTCIPEPTRRELSQRTAQVADKLDELIRRWSDEHDGSDPDPRTIATLERTAAVSSRRAKDHALPAAGLHRLWADQARATGFDPDILLAGRLRADPPSVPTDAELMAEALRRVTEETSTWLRADIARHLATLLSPAGDHTAAEAVAHIDRLAAQVEAACVALVPPAPPTERCRRDGRPSSEHLTDRRLTTTAILRQEEALQRWAQANARPTPPTDDPQTAAAEAMAGPASLILVVGPAGTGKTTTVAGAVESLQARGRPVVGLAPAGKAADVLAQEAGCPTDTLAAFLLRHESGRASPLPLRTTIVLDEAGMAATEDLARLVGLVRRHHWRLVAVGDPAQLSAVGRGGVFAHWCNTIHHHKLTMPRRFDAPWEAEASLLLRAGDPRAAEIYADHGRIRTAHPALIPREIAQAHQRHVAAGQTVAITTTTAETARAINREIQHLLDPRHQRPRVTLADGAHASPGDTIATRRNDPTLRTDQDNKVRNRQTWTVTAVEADGTLSATHPTRGMVALPPTYAFHHVELAWAVTGYGNQGDTVDVGLAVLTSGTTRNHAYVAMTRGRRANLGVLPQSGDPGDAADLFTHIIDGPVHPLPALSVLAKSAIDRHQSERSAVSL